MITDPQNKKRFSTSIGTLNNSIVKVVFKESKKTSTKIHFEYDSLYMMEEYWVWHCVISKSLYNIQISKFRNIVLGMRNYDMICSFDRIIILEFAHISK